VKVSGGWCRLLLATVVGVAPALAFADDTMISDWRGVSVRVKEGVVDSKGVKIVYHTAGQGPLVIMVHSITGPWFDWRQQIPALAQRYQVVAMSTRGTDRSDKPEGVDNYTVAKVAEDIDAIIRHFGKDKAIIIGTDSGGFNAWNFAMTHPEKTDRLIAIGTPHPAGLIRELATNPDQQKASAFQRGMQENPDAATDFSNRLRSRPPRADDTPELARMRKEAYGRLYAESIVNFYKANWPRPPFSLETEGFGFRIGTFPQVQAPTLMIYGASSGTFLPGTLNDLWRWVDKDLTLQVLPGVGNAPHTEVPEVVTPLIMEWLARPNSPW
jgi:pimeloyl-ACP methyl ester carboxylesterase